MIDPEPEPQRPLAAVKLLALVSLPGAVGEDHIETRSPRDTPEQDSRRSEAHEMLLPVTVPHTPEFADGRSDLGDDDRPEPLSRPMKIAYWIVFVVLALSVLGFIYVHVRPTGSGSSAHEAAPTTSTSAARTTTTTTVALPAALKPGADDAATALVSSWSTGDRAAALTVATPAAVTVLFAMPYASGLAIDRGCSTSFSPIVCTFGPPGGASPNDPIYQIDVSQAAGGWYVSSVRIEN